MGAGQAPVAGASGTGSEMRRAARSLVEAQPVTIASDYPVEESVGRLTEWSREGAARLKVVLDVSAEDVTVRRDGESVPMFRGSWRPHEGGTRLEGEFPPSPSVPRMLRLSSMALALLIGLAAWALVTSTETSIRVGLVLLTGVCLLLFPYAILALASQSLARQAALKRALERALRGENK